MPDTAKVAVLGSVDFVMPFSALGLDTFAAGPSTSEIAKSAARILEDKYALVVVAENIAPAAEEFFAAVQNNPIPCIVVVPFTEESGGFATDALGQVLKMATGINILQAEQEKS